MEFPSDDLCIERQIYPINLTVCENIIASLLHHDLTFMSHIYGQV